MNRDELIDKLTDWLRAEYGETDDVDLDEVGPKIGVFLETCDEEDEDGDDTSDDTEPEGDAAAESEK